jgi:two-component system sensor histidine kinase KdpD
MRERAPGWVSVVERRRVRPFGAAAGSVAAVTVVTLAIYGLRELGAPVLSLGVLYLFAVLLVAALWRMPYALVVAVVSMLAFNWLFLPPVHTFHLKQSENWIALAVYLLTALSVSALAERAARRAEESERRRREALFAAEVAGLLLEREGVRAQLGSIAARVAELLAARSAQLGLDEPAPAGSVALRAGARSVGWLSVVAGEVELPNTTRSVAAVLGPLLATALDRERLARDDAAKTAILRSVSHDLRSPITAIRSAGELLERGAGDPEELLASIRAQARRLDRLVGNLLELSRLEAGAAAPAPELWPVDGLVARALEALGPENARVEVELAADAPPVRVDPAQVEHALVNLLENALAFSPPEERVDLSAGAEEGRVVLRVADRGPGIAEAERERIFEPFARGAGGRPGGSGLGLAIARGFAELNGGELVVERAAGGAVFALSFPAAAAPAWVRA